MFSNIQLTEKIKKISSGGCKNASQRFVLMKGYFGRKNKKLSSRACIYALHLLNMCKDIFEPAEKCFLQQLEIETRREKNAI
ncbi:MAG: hypothetical protein ACLTHR_06040 [Agathobacter rectalis]